MKKFLALVLALAMILNLGGFSVFADGETVTDTEVGYYDASYPTGVASIYGEAYNVVASSGFYVELYSGEELVGTTTLNDPKKQLLNDASCSITWHAALTDDGDEWWKTTWEGGALKADKLPDNLKMYIDGELSRTGEIQKNKADLANPVFAVIADENGNVTEFVDGTGFRNGVGDNAMSFDEAFAEAMEAINDGETITLLEDVNQLPKITKAITIDGNGKTVAGSDDGQFGTINGTVTLKNLVYANGTQAIRTNYKGVEYTGLDLVIDNCVFNDVAGWAIIGGSTDGDEVTLKSLTVNECTFNAGETNGNYMISAQSVNTLTVTDCIFNGNNVTKGAINTGESTTQATVAVISGNTIDSVERGVQIGNRVEGSSVSISENTFTNVNADGKTGAVYIHSNSSAETTDVAVSANTFDSNSVVLYNDGKDETALNGMLDFADDNTQDNVVITELKTAGTEVSVTVSAPVEVHNYEELAKLFTNGDREPVKAIMMNDITGPGDLSSGYGVTGIIVQNGDVLDGGNHKLTITGADTTWDCAVAVKGGTVKNLTVAGAFRGFFMPGANGDLLIENCVTEDVVYTFNSDSGSDDYTVTIKNSTLNGWTSYSAVHKLVTFENCTFGEGSGYAYCRPYENSNFEDCEFNEDFELDASRADDGGLAFNDCTYNDTPFSEISDADLNQMFSSGGTVIIDEETKTFEELVAYIDGYGYPTIADAVAALKEGDTLTIGEGTFEEGTIKLPATLKNVTIKGADDKGTILKNMTVMSSDGTSYSYEGITIDGIVFDNSGIVVTGWRTGETSLKDWTITNCHFKDLSAANTTAPIHFNLAAGEAVNGLTITDNVIENATGGDKSGVYAQVTGNVNIENNVIKNVQFRPVLLQIADCDNIVDNIAVSENTFSENSNGRLQIYGSEVENEDGTFTPTGTDSGSLKINDNIFMNVETQYICAWGIGDNVEVNIANNYYETDIATVPSKLFWNNVTADSTSDLEEMGIYPYYTALNEDGTIDRTSAVYPASYVVAKVGETEYKKIADAVSALKANGGTLTLLNDVYESITLNYPAEDAVKDLTIDLNGFKVSSGESTLWVSDGYNVTVKDSSTDKTGKLITTSETDEAIAIARGGKVTLEGGTVEGVTYGVYLYSGNATGEESFVQNGGTVTVPNGGNAISIGSGKAKINGGKVLCNKVPNGGGWLIYVYEGGALEITGGEFLGTIGNYGATSISGGKFSYCDDPNDGFRNEHLAEGYVAICDLNGNYIVGKAPTATVNNLGAMTVPAEDYMVYGNGDNTAPMDLSFVMQFLADQSEEDMETSPYADWYGDFVITFEGIENESFTADGCYLAGHYGSFGWVKVPVDGMEIKNEERYPVMLGVGMGQKYDYICSEVEDFKCAMYIPQEILDANPNLKVKLELTVVDNSMGSDAAKEAIINNENVYNVTGYTYTADDFVKADAEINGVKYATLEEAMKAVKDGEKITLLADVTISEPIKIAENKNLTFDGAGHTLTYTGSDRAFEVTSDANGANLTIENLTIDCTASYCNRGVNYNTTGTLTLDTVTIKGTNITYAVNLPASADGAKVYVSNSTIETACFAINGWGENMDINVTDSSLASAKSNEVETYAAIAFNKSDENSAKGSKLTVTGGKLSGTYTDGTLCWAVRINCEDVEYSISETTEVIGNIYNAANIAAVQYPPYDEFYGFSNLQAAVDKAANDYENGTTSAVVVLLGDVELTESIKVTGTVTVDLNGHKITGPDVPATKSYYAFIVDGGNMTLKDSSEEKTGEIWAKCYGVETKSGSFTMESGKITATNNTSLGTAIANYGGTVTINGGTLAAAQGAVYTDGYFSDAETIINDVEITEGVVDVFSSSDEYTETAKSSKDTYPVYDGYGWELGEDNLYELVEMPIMVTYADGTVKYFAEMTDAVPNSNKNTMDGATIKLLNDYTGAGVRFFDDVTLDLNGKTYTVTKSAGSKGTETSGFQLRPESYGVTIKNGTIAVAKETEGSVVWLLNSYTGVVLEDVTLDCANLAKTAYGDSCMAVIAHDETFEIKGESKIINFSDGLTDAAIAVAVADNANYEGGVAMTIAETVAIDGKVEVGSGEASLTTTGSFNIVAEEGYELVNNNGVYTAEEIEEETLNTRIYFLHRETTDTSPIDGNQAYRTRVYAGVDSLKYKSVGFEYRLLDTTLPELSTSTTVVYSSFTAKVGEKTLYFTPNQFKASSEGVNLTHIFALNIWVPQSYGSKRLEVRAYAENEDGTKIYSEWYKAPNNADNSAVQ